MLIFNYQESEFSYFEFEFLTHHMFYHIYNVNSAEKLVILISVDLIKFIQYSKSLEVLTFLRFR